MRVLLAYDGSADADTAVALARNVRWPTGSTIRIVAVVESALLYTPPIPSAPVVASRIEAEVAAAAEEGVQAAAGILASEDRTVEPVVVRGRPASVILEEAGRFGADLLITGSRGRGPITRLLLGSVSAEVVEHAPCPVMVTRAESISRVVLAVDGSPAAAAAEQIVSAWPVFEDVPVEVVSVAEVAEPWQFNLAPPRYHAAAAQHASNVEETKAHHTRIADDAADRLRSAGREAQAVMRTGDAAGEILGAASDGAADLIVMGSRGRTGLTTMLLGSVARNVLQSTTASVLVVRDEGGGGADQA